MRTCCFLSICCRNHELSILHKIQDYLGVKTFEVFLCFVAIVRVRVYSGWLLGFLCFSSPVSVTGSYTEDELNYKA